jgi:hypothetical protein
VDIGLASPVAAAPALAVVDRHLADMARERDRELSGRVGDPKQGIRERGALVGTAEVGGENGGQPVDDR